MRRQKCPKPLTCLRLPAAAPRRIVFTCMEKFDGVHLRRLTAPEVKQIAGRAGRFGSSFAEGQVACLNQARRRAGLGY